MAGSSEGRKKKSKRSKRSAELIKALDHTLRRRILRAMIDGDGPISPVRLAEQLNASLGNVSYHVTILRELGAIGHDSQRQVRGAMEHFYVPTIEDNAAIMALLGETRKEDEAAS